MVMILQCRRRQWPPTPVLFLENPMDGGAWWAAVHGVAKSPARLSDFTFTFHFHTLEKEMATHFSILAWRVPGTEEPTGLPSMGSHRVGHNWSDLAAAAAVPGTHWGSWNIYPRIMGIYCSHLHSLALYWCCQLHSYPSHSFHSSSSLQGFILIAFHFPKHKYPHFLSWSLTLMGRCWNRFMFYSLHSSVL